MSAEWKNTCWHCDDDPRWAGHISCTFNKYTPGNNWTFFQGRSNFSRRSKFWYFSQKMWNIEKLCINCNWAVNCQKPTPAPFWHFSRGVDHWPRGSNPPVNFYLVGTMARTFLKNWYHTWCNDGMQWHCQFNCMTLSWLAINDWNI